MRKILLMLTLALAAGAAQAQIKCWNDPTTGKRVCGDTPPPGVKGTAIRGTQSSEPSAPAASSKDAKKGPLTPAEREQEYRKRQSETAKASEKAEAEQKEKQLKKENCDQAQDSLRMLESGQRIARTNPSGERYYLDDTQREQEIIKGREAVKRSCG